MVKEILPFDTHFTANLPPSAILKKFILFSKNSSFFSAREINILNILRKITVSVAFYVKVATIWSKNSTFRNVNKIADVARTEFANIW